MAAINKNFVIKNGLEISTDLIIADANTRKVGIGTTVPQYTLHVNGGIGVTDVYVSGITTVINELRVGTGGTIFSVIAGPTGFGQSVGVGTARPAFLLDVRSPVSTGQTALYVQGDVRITGDLSVDDISITNLNVSGVSTFVGFATFNNNIFVAGIGTITNLVSTSGTITNLTGTSGTITTFNSTTGNITNLTNTNLNVTGIATIATLNATGIAVTNFTVYNNLSVGGISTFTNGPVLIGSGTSTGTASQTLQVTGGTYVSGNLGIGSTNPTSKLDVIGDARVTGVITATTFIGDVNAGVGTITNLTGTAGTITTFNSTNGTITNLNVTGISTLGTVRISSGIITATSGIVTYFGDGQYLNLSNSPYKGIGIGTTGGLVGYGITFLDLKGAGVSTTFYNSSVGIATIFFEGGGGSGSIGIGSTFTGGAANGDLFYHIDYGRIFVYYDEVVLGIGTDAFWVDAAPFNVGIITSLSNVSFSPGSAVAPSMFFIGDNQTGFFSPGNGQFTVVSSGSSVLNVNASGIRVTGVTTITNASGTVTIGIGTTALLVEGNARVTGILTVGSSSITLNGTSNIINVGTGLTLSSGGINITGVITATSFFGNGSGLTGVGLGTTGSINTSGIITATSFFGSGANLTGVGLGTTGSINTSGIITATSFFGNGSGLTGVAATTLTIGAGTTAAPSISPTGDSNTGIFFPSADTIAFGEGGAEAMRVDSSGRLLIGTSTSRVVGGGTGPLQVESTSNSRPITNVANENSIYGPGFALGKSRGASVGSNTIVQSNDHIGFIDFCGADGSDLEVAATISAFVDGTPGANDMPGRLIFSTTVDGASSPTERMRITNGGLFSFNNAATPTAKYYLYGYGSGNSLTNVTGAGSTDTYYIGMHVDNPGRGYNVTGRNIGIYGTAVGTGVSVHSAIGVLGYASGNVGNSDAIGVYGSTAVSAYGSEGPTVGVYGRRHGGGGSNGGGYGVFARTGSSLYAENYALKAYVDAETSGHSAAKAISITDENTGTRTAIEFVRAAAVVGSITYTTSATAYNTSSDYRLKENIGNLNGALERLLDLKVRRFNFISTPETTVDGFIAHEVKDIVPEAVTGEKDQVREETYVIERAIPAVLDDDGNEIEPVKPPVLGTKTVPVYQGIDQSKLVPLLTAALQEAIAKIETLEQRLTAAGI